MPGLTIKRSPLTKVMIGDCVITVVEIKGKYVTLNIVAPNRVSISRLDADGVPEHKEDRRREDET